MTCHVAQRPLAGLQVVKSQVDPEHRPAETRDRSGCPLRRKTQRGAVLCSGSDVLALTIVIGFGPPCCAATLSHERRRAAESDSRATAEARRSDPGQHLQHRDGKAVG